MMETTLDRRQAKRILSSIEEIAQVSNYDAAKIADKATKISSIIGAYAPEYTPFDYQARYLDDYTTRFKIFKKARQIGCSHMAAHKGVVRSMSIPRHQTLLLSLSLADAKNKIDYAYRLYDEIGRDIGAPAVDNKSRMELSFVNGSKLTCVYTPRGKDQADIVLDEFAHYLDPEAIWQATLPIMVHKGSRLLVMSTPLHSMTMFHSIFEGEKGKYKSFDREKIFWWDCPVHCHDIKRARREIVGPGDDRAILTEDSVEQFGSDTLKEIFDSMPLDQFETEFELKEIDDDTALLPMALILRTTPTGEDAIEPAFSLHDVAQRTRGKNLYGGMDVGRIKDAGELTIFVEEDDGRLYEIYTRTFIDTPFDIQEEHCHEALMLPNLMRFVIDATGMGQPMGESLEKRWGHRAMPLKFSGPQVSSLATMQKMYMEKDKVVYLWDQDRNAQMHAVKKHISHSGHRVSFGAPRGKGGTGRRHHGDVFWSRAMGIWGHADLKSYGKPRVRFL